MNNDGRKRIDAIMRDIEAAAKVREEVEAMVSALNEKLEKYKQAFEDTASAIEELRDEEQEKFDNLSDGLQQSERGQALEATVSALETALELVQAVGELEEYEFTSDTDEMITALDDAKYAS